MNRGKRSLYTDVVLGVVSILGDFDDSIVEGTEPKFMVEERPLTQRERLFQQAEREAMQEGDNAEAL